MITTKSGGLRLDLPDSRQPPGRRARRAGEASSAAPVPYPELRRRERDNLLAALRATGWKVYGPGGAAELLQVRPTTLASRIKKMGLEKSADR